MADVTGRGDGRKTISKISGVVASVRLYTDLLKVFLSFWGTEGLRINFVFDAFLCSQGPTAIFCTALANERRCITCTKAVVIAKCFSRLNILLSKNTNALVRGTNCCLYVGSVSSFFRVQDRESRGTEEESVSAHHHNKIIQHCIF